MKDLKDFIYESEQPEFVNKVAALAKEYGITIKNESSSLKLMTLKGYSKVDIKWYSKNAWSGVRGAVMTSSEFDNEPLFISISDWFDKHMNKDYSKTSEINKLSKELYNSLFDAGLKEATNGRNSQWGTWKFAIRSEKDEATALNHLETYMKALSKAKN